MGDEVKEKPEQKETRRAFVSITMPDVPIAVHNKLIKYRRKISGERQKDYNIMAAYTEFLKEATKELAL